MKNRRHYLATVIATCVLILVGCEEDFLNSSPTDVLTEEQIYSNEVAFNAHMAYLYSEMPFPDNFSDGWVSYNTDEMVGGLSGGASLGTANDWWDAGYNLIRSLNKVIEGLPDAKAFDEARKNELMGEIKFMRAYAYYSLVRRYGGVPIVTESKPLPGADGVSELYQARDTEAKVFRFIQNEMTEAINMMSDPVATPTEYRINKWSALAFKSQVMLTAASIAKYGDIQLDGLLGIPQSEATQYWESARDAAKQVIDSERYELYNEGDDKVINYHNMLFDESEANKERIFVTAYSWPENGHNYDRNVAPFSHRSTQGYGGAQNATFDMVESYEYTDDRDGSLKLENNDGTPKEYEDPTDLFTGKDPRFFASHLFPGSPWKGDSLEIYAQIIEGGEVQSGFGEDGIAQPEATSTGIYISKWEKRDTPRPIATGSSDVDFIGIRYAEVLLNYAEAQLELNNEIESRKYVNKIRQRAGLQPYTSSITMDEYRHERKIEFAYEGHRYWDLKRWRTYDEVLSNRPTYALWPILNKDKGVYIFNKHQLPPGKFTRNFTSEMYYNRIPSGAIENNRLLVQNPGY